MTLRIIDLSMASEHNHQFGELEITLSLCYIEVAKHSLLVLFGKNSGAWNIGMLRSDIFVNGNMKKESFLLNINRILGSISFVL